MKNFLRISFCVLAIIGSIVTFCFNPLLGLACSIVALIISVILLTSYKPKRKHIIFKNKGDLRKVYNIPLEDKELETIGYALGRLKMSMQEEGVSEALKQMADPHHVFLKINGFIKKIED